MNTQHAVSRLRARKSIQNLGSWSSTHRQIVAVYGRRCIITNISIGTKRKISLWHVAESSPPERGSCVIMGNGKIRVAIMDCGRAHLQKYLDTSHRKRGAGLHTKSCYKARSVRAHEKFDPNIISSVISLNFTNAGRQASYHLPIPLHKGSTVSMRSASLGHCVKGLPCMRLLPYMNF